MQIACAEFLYDLEDGPPPHFRPWKKRRLMIINDEAQDVMDKLDSMLSPSIATSKRSGVNRNCEWVHAQSYRCLPFSLCARDMCRIMECADSTRIPLNPVPEWALNKQVFDRLSEQI